MTSHEPAQVAEEESVMQLFVRALERKTGRVLTNVQRGLANQFPDYMASEGSSEDWDIELTRMEYQPDAAVYAAQDRFSRDVEQRLQEDGLIQHVGIQVWWGGERRRLPIPNTGVREELLQEVVSKVTEYVPQDSETPEQIPIGPDSNLGPLLKLYVSESLRGQVVFSNFGIDTMILVGLLDKRIRRKAKQYDGRRRPGRRLMLLVHSTRRHPPFVGSDEALAIARESAVSVSHPFDEIWYFWPTGYERIPGQLLKVWPYLT